MSELPPREPTDRRPDGPDHDSTGPTALSRIDLADRRLGGLVLTANDEYFAPKEALLRPRLPRFDPHAYTERGKLMDGWETRRRRSPGQDWCVVRLGVPGIVEELVVDTTHFRGNAPARCAVDALDVAPADPFLADAAELAAREDWEALLPWSDLAANHVNLLAVAHPRLATHVRLRIDPDGGVARLRVRGRPVPPLVPLADPAGRLEVAGSLQGGTVVGCSDAFFSPPQNLLAPGEAVDMGDGWETRRRRGGRADDWVVVALAAESEVERVDVSTLHFTGNYPEQAAIDVARVDAGPGGGSGGPPRQAPVEDGTAPGLDWAEAIAPSPLAPHARHTFHLEPGTIATHVRLRLVPDGGAARLRIHGRPTARGWETAGMARLDAALPSSLRRLLAECCAASRWVDGMARQQPFGTWASLARAADDVWARMGPDDWQEAFAAHPRIGDPQASGRSADEQRGASEADAEARRALAEGNQAYEERFGHVFLIRAAGRSAAEILAALRERLDNDPETEVRIAAEQQRQILQLRLAALVYPAGQAPTGIDDPEGAHG